MRVLADRRSLLEDIHRRDRSATSSTNNPTGAQDAEAEADLAHSEASQRSRLESGRALLRDALSYERPGRRLRIPRQTTLSEAPAPTVFWRPDGTEDIEDSQTSARANEARSPPAQYLPSPFIIAGDSSNRFNSHVPSSSLGTALLTPRFAPAHRLDGEEEAQANAVREEVLARLSSRMEEVMDSGEREYIAGHAAQIARMRALDHDALTPEVREQEAAYLELVETLMRRVRDHEVVEYPHSRRISRSSRAMSRSQRRYQHHSNFDGLGDRERSFSPDDDQWETMLTTIPLDERVPSAHSSFTSATASSTSSSSNPSSSYGTMITAPSTSNAVEVCPGEYEESEDDSIHAFDAQIAQVESQADRIEALSQRLDHQQYRDEQITRRRRMLEREQELQQMEANLQRLESQISEERPIAAGRHVGMSGRTARERL